MATTTNFNWSTPDDTSLVKDGAAAIRTLGSSIDTSFVDLKGGTTGQVLSKASNTDLDYSWTTVAAGGMTLLSTTTITGTPSTVTVSGISNSYKNLIINVTDFYASANNVKLRMTFNNDTGSNYRTQNTTSTTPYDSGVIGYLEITEFITSASNANSLNIFVNDYTTAFNKNGTTNIAVVSSTVLNCSNTDWAYKSTSAINRFDITTSTGTITQGTIKVYGVN